MIAVAAGMIVCSVLSMAAADNTQTCSYDPRLTFSPLTLPEAVNTYRSSNGAPGPSYWQNEADYEIHANLHPESKEITGSELITYSNNSPDKLDSLWLQLDQNSYRSNARALVLTGRSREQSTSGMTIQSVVLPEANGPSNPEIVVSDTRLQIRLQQPIAPHGGSIKLRIQYRYTIPDEDIGDRTSWGETKNGAIFDVAQWYPRMAVYDDLHGWDTQPYLASEFYLEYGQFDYFVTLPANMLVAGSGELVNGAQVLSANEQKRLTQARGSDTTVLVRDGAEMLAAAAQAKVGSNAAAPTKTWHFRMARTRDVSFSASSAFLWDAARINLPDGKTSLAMSFYPAESAGNSAWGRSTEYLKHAVQEFSRNWYPYPYPAAINVAGPSSGMEYPGILFDGISDKGKELFWVTAHEIGHTWFPMIVGFNERRNAWMDEGFNTFIDVGESDAFQNGVYGPKRDSEYAPHGGNPVDEILPFLKDPNAPTILSRADAIAEKYRHPISYFKSALGLVLLREQVLGPQRFDYAFRRFIREWAFHHPSPSDFFRAMESDGGEDLSWFWRGWYMNNWTLDLAVRGVKDSSLTLQNCGQLVMPATVQVRFKDGTTTHVELPVETWLQSGTYHLELPASKKFDSATVDPQHVLPDVDRSNNSFGR